MRALSLTLGTVILLAAAALLWVPRGGGGEAETPVVGADGVVDEEGREFEGVVVVPYVGPEGAEVPGKGVATFAARLVDENGQGISDLALRIEGGTVGRVAERARTDARGELRFSIPTSLAAAVRLVSDSKEHWIEPSSLEDLRGRDAALIRVYDLTDSQRVRVLAMGQPVVQAEIRVAGASSLAVTDDFGRALIPLPDRSQLPSHTDIRLLANARGMMPYQGSVRSLQELGSEWELQMEPARPITAVVRDESATPIANVRAFLDGREVARSNAEGTLQIREFPRTREGKLELIHPAYTSTSVLIGPSAEPPILLSMTKGVPLRIRAIAPEGVPAESLLFTISANPSFRARGHPDEEGVLTLHVPPRSNLLVQCEGRGVLKNSVEVMVADEPLSVDVTLERSHALSVTVTLPDGRPSASALVSLSQELDGVLAKSRTDSFGVCRFEGLKREQLQVAVTHYGSLTQEIIVAPATENLRVQLEWAPAARFRILDAVTGKPAGEARFVYLSPDGLAVRRTLRANPPGSGLFLLAASQPLDSSHRLVLVEAPERRLLLVPTTFRAEQEPPIQDLVLTAGAPLIGIVRDRSTGLPIPGASVRIVMEGRLREAYDALNVCSETDELGAFDLATPTDENFSLSVTAAGYAQATRVRRSDATSIWLEPGGDLHVEAHGAGGERLVIAVVPVLPGEDTLLQVPLDPEGRARINLPFGQYKFRVLSANPGWTAYPPVLNFQTESSQVVVLSRDGVTDLVGKVRVPTGDLGGQAMLVLKPLSESAAPDSRTTRSGGDGAFRFRSVLPGRYELKASVTVDGRVHVGTTVLDVAPNHPPIDLLIRVER